jgi:hypothetical protein
LEAGSGSAKDWKAGSGYESALKIN